MRKPVWVAIAVLAIAAAAVGVAVGANGTRDDKTFEYSIGLWGDLLYSPAQQDAIPALIQDMNESQLAFTVHDGDLKQGSGSPCDNALYARAFDWFQSFDGAAMFTPGDNDWTDCDRTRASPASRTGAGRITA